MDITIHPSKTDESNCGITSYDIELMQGYINHYASIISKFDEPWQLIAGDINRDGIMNATDVTLAGAIMAGSPGRWTFVPTNVYAGMAAPNGIIFGYTYSEEISYFPLTSNHAGVDFFGIKLRDSTMAVVRICNGKRGRFDDDEPAKVRTKANTITIPLVDHGVATGREFALPISLENAEAMHILAWEFNFDAEKFEFVGIREGALPFLSDAAFVTPTDQPGKIRFVWSNLDLSSIPTDKWKNMFSVVLRSKSYLPSLREHIHITALDGNPSFADLFRVQTRDRVVQFF